jgi:putative oxidoreductase
MYRRFPELGLLLVRLTLGSIFFLHGSQKVLGLFGGPGLEGFVKWAATMNIPEWLAYLGAFSEFIGGILLFLGIFVELGALAVISVMIGAIYYVHSDSGYFIQNGGFEYPLNLILFSFAILIGGPGALSLWDCCKK